jgi:UDP-glucuronate 4-epimerase
MNILVTGAAGFIGSHVCEYLINSGYSVFGLDNFDPYYDIRVKEHNLSQLSQNDRFQFYRADIRDSKALTHMFSNSKIEVVIHLAAKAGVRPSIESIEEYYDVNVNGTITMLEAMRKNGVRKMLFASSSSIYGNNSVVPFSETAQVDHPISPYASTKKSGELLCHVFHHLYNFDITCLRFFTVYGPRQRPDLAIHKFTRLIDEGKPIPFYGDGSTGRDYTFINDILDGIIGAFKNLNGFNIYNLGGSNVISLSKLVEIIESTLGKKAILEKMPLQPGDVIQTFADISKANKEFGYNPQTKIEAGIKQFIDWYQSLPVQSS